MRLDHLLSREQAEGKPEASSRSIATQVVLRKREEREREQLAVRQSQLSPLNLYRFQGSEKNPGRRDPPRTLTTAQRIDEKESLERPVAIMKIN